MDRVKLLKDVEGTLIANMADQVTRKEAQVLAIMNLWGEATESDYE